MKKKIWIPIVVFISLAILFIPIPTGVYKDGGTREYTALTYKIVDWNRLTGDSIYDKTKVYFFPYNFKSIDGLWYYEKDEIEHRFVDKEPVQHMEFENEWIDKSTASKYDNDIFRDIKITEIYSNCFFAVPVIPMPYEIKLNGKLSDEWCVGDQVICTYENTYYDHDKQRVECDFLTVEESDWEADPDVCYKPVIYFYPKEKMDVKVNLMLDGRLTCTYPTYENGWGVTALPDGTLTDSKGQQYNYLYWEGETYARYDMSKGFCVKGEDTAEFLEDALEKLGLNRRETNEFIVYWLPLMEQNPYNIISFQTDIYTEAAQLQISPEPDTLIRVFMAWKKSDVCVPMKEQKLYAPERSGFTVVEWGGTELK